MDTMPGPTSIPATSNAGRMTTPPMPTAPIINAPTQHAKITSTISPADMADTAVSSAIVAVSRRARVWRGPRTSRQKA